MSQRRILVLSSSTGSGHDMRAQAFVDWVQALYGESVDVRREQIIENSSWLGAFGVWVYNVIQRRAPWLHQIYWHIVEVFISSHAQSVSFGGRYYRKLLASYRPHVVFSVHDSTNRGYFADARAVLGAQNVQCVTYCGEYGGGAGFSKNWVDPTADLFLARTAEARDYAVQLGMPRDKTALLTAFLPPRFFDTAGDDFSRAKGLTDIGLEEGRFTIFLATGGYGANHHRRFLAALKPLAEKVQVIVVCGRNLGAHRRVQKWLLKHQDFPVHLEAYSKRMRRYLRLADVIVTRGGANTTTEALQVGCPVLFNTLGGIMPQESLTIQALKKRADAPILRKPEDLAQHVQTWLAEPAAFAAYQAKWRAQQDAQTPQAVVTQIVGMAQACAQAAPQKVTPSAQSQALDWKPEAHGRPSPQT